MPRISALPRQRVHVGFDRIVDAKIDNLEPGAFHHHADKVLADVVDVAFDGADHHLADRAGAGFGQKRLAGCHAALHRICASRTSGTNRMPSRKSSPTIVMPPTSASVRTRYGFPFALQQDVDALPRSLPSGRRRGRRTSVDELFVVQFRRMMSSSSAMSRFSTALSIPDEPVAAKGQC